VNPILLIAAAAQQPHVPAEEARREEIVVTASLAPSRERKRPASVTIFDAAQIEALGSVFAADFLRLAPGVSVSVSGAQGGQTQVRIRGAEANHTLLFVDGSHSTTSRPATSRALRDDRRRGPRQDRADPRAAIGLWGSEALGGVVAVESPEPLGSMRATASAEYGSRDFARASAAFRVWRRARWTFGDRILVAQLTGSTFSAAGPGTGTASRI
jgi:vitamin B12 transporter